jgi:hypothetical protein
MKIHVILLIIVLSFFSCHKKKKDDTKTLYSQFYYDYEDAIKKGFPNAVYNGLSISGDYSNILDENKKFGISEKKYISEIECPNFNEVNFQAWICPLDTIMNGVFVFSIIDTSTNKSKLWEGFEIKKSIKSPKNWFQIKGKIPIDLVERNPGDKIHFYFWNPDSSSFLVDDLEVNLCNDFASGNVFFYDLENNPDFEKSNTLSNEFAYSGKTSSKVSGKNSYSISLEKPMSDVQDFAQLSKVSLSCWLKPTEPIVDAVLVFTLIDTITKKSDYWQGKVIEDLDFKTNKWTKASAQFLLPDSIAASEKFQIYLWNRKGNTLFVDDFYVSFSHNTEEEIEPYLDLTKGNYEQQKKINYPPFRTKHLNKQQDLTQAFEEKNINAKNIIASVTGNFSNANTEIQTMLLSKKGEIFFLSNEFKKDSIPSSFDLNSFHSLVSVNLDNDLNDEIILANSDSILLGNFDVSTNKFSWNIFPLEKEIKSLNRFNNQLLVHTNNGLYFLKISEKVSFIKLAHPEIENNFWKNYQVKLIAGNFYKKNHESIICFFSNSNSHLFKIIDIDKNNSLKITDGLTIGADTLTANNEYFNADINANGLDELISYNNSWRCDIKTLHFVDNYFIIDHVIDFKNFEKDLNPKFYENLKLFELSTNNNFGILLHGFNINVNTDHPYFNKITDFPETIQLYAF